MKRSVRIALRVALGVVACGAIAALNVGALTRSALTPGAPFDAAALPPAPDYADPRSWSALPERDDAGDAAPPSAPAVDQRRAAADVFYVHSTSYVGRSWNADTNDTAVNDATDRGATGIQATAFNGCCAVYAPRYRQANGMAFTRSSADGDRAIDVAYGDVRRAFDAFNARRGAGRPFLLAAHSQGTVMAERLLREAISGSALRDQLVAAYLIGGAVTVDGLRERAPDVPPCRAADDVRCAVAWNARGAAYVPSDFEMHRPDPRERLCTNPLSWRTDGARAPADLNLGAVFLESDDRAPRARLAGDVQCVDGTLIVHDVGETPRDLPSRILDRVLGEENYHAIEFQLFFMNLRENAASRLAAFLAASARQSR
ncbi:MULTISPECIES: DUF3089 domain-containing protein [Sorangium]|uniref:DUF3089 domain-containing protein n=1 Tax=Sorangium cellulosum TaxID=56 RepID=A0A4P2QLG0_SORCE|nr:MULTISPECIES: DUF3089 domain-containing protein [Sorangium]AUX30879.1 hypothetical protein SOCE836_029930 [Sorangium cellulosum]WCQ90260.1 hypothetical protein NQZ70_02963 [Sorangium sp. Soce836]